MPIWGLSTESMKPWPLPPGGGKVKQPRATEMVRGWCALCLCVRASEVTALFFIPFRTILLGGARARSPTCIPRDFLSFSSRWPD